MKIKKFQAIFDPLAKASEINAKLKAQLLKYNVTTFSFTYYTCHPQSKNKIKFDYCSNNFRAWHNHYIEEDYETIDTTLAKLYQSNLPVFWDLAIQLKEATTPKERQMRVDSIAFGAEKGLAIPLHGADDDFANLLLVQMKGETCLDEWLELQDDFILLANCYYQAIKKTLLLNHTDNRYHLTSREMQCLLLTARNQCVKKIAGFLKIKERTVNFHIQSANKKLGTNNKYQSVAKALEKGIISF